MPTSDRPTPTRCPCGAVIDPRLVMCDPCFRTPGKPPLPPDPWPGWCRDDTRSELRTSDKHRYGVDPKGVQ